MQCVSWEASRKMVAIFWLVWFYKGLCYSLSKTQDAELGVFDTSVGWPENGRIGWDT